MKTFTFFFPGNFLLKLNSTDDVTRPARVFLNRTNIVALTLCVWLKPNTSEGTIFTYATDKNLMALALFFNRSHVRVLIYEEEIAANIVIPVRTWTHLCFIWKWSDKTLWFYQNGFVVHTAVNLTSSHQLKAKGAFVAGFQQSSPGIIAKTSTCDLVLSGLYAWSFKVHDIFLFRFFNEPYVSKFTIKAYLVDWRDFYRRSLPFNTTVIYPTKELKLGNFDWRFRGGEGPITANLPGKYNLREFSFCMWLKSNLSKATSSSVFTVKSGFYTIMKFLLKSDNDCDFTLNSQTRTIPNCTVNGDDGWHHLCIDWLCDIGHLHIYVDGIIFQTKYDIKTSETLSEISNGTVELGDNNFVGDITSVNVWSRALDDNFIFLLALQAGNIQGDLFSWTMVEEKSDFSKTRKIVPSMFSKEKTYFDLLFPPPAPNETNYITYDYLLPFPTLEAISVAFWIKTPSTASPFTLFSFAIPKQVNEFNIHFGTKHIWMYIKGDRWLIPFELRNAFQEWQHLFFQWHGYVGTLRCWHNGVLISKETGEIGIIEAKDGFLVVGAQQTQHKVVSRNEYRFHGQISQLQVWKKKINYRIIQGLANRCSSIPGDVLRWSDMPAGINGNVEKRNSSECLEIKDGEH